MDISLCIIVRNEEKTIGRCLDSIKEFVDEIVIVDTGSNDNTIKVASKYTKNIYEYNWNDDFSAARNYCFSMATKEYILWLDADDVFIEKYADEFMHLKKSKLKDVDFVVMNYILSTYEKDKALYSIRRNRIVKRSKFFKWQGRVHEYLDVYGKGLISDIGIKHIKVKDSGDRNLKIYEKMLLEGQEFTARDLYYYANELKDNKLYIQAIERYREFIKGCGGWIEDKKKACLKLSECYSIMKDYDKEVNSVLQSLKYGVLDSEVCCKLGAIFLRKEDFEKAIYWYKMALKNRYSNDYMLGINHGTYTWIPCLQLCVCYGKIGNYKKAYYYNEKAAEFVPNHSSVKYNRVTLQKISG